MKKLFVLLYCTMTVFTAAVIFLGVVTGHPAGVSDAVTIAGNPAGTDSAGADQGEKRAEDPVAVGTDSAGADQRERRAEDPVAVPAWADQRKAAAREYYERGNAYARWGDLDRAIADFDEAIRIKADYVAAYTDRGVAYALKEEPDRAIADFTEAIRIDPNHFTAYYNRLMSTSTIKRRNLIR